MFYETLMATVAAMATALYSSLDKSIAAVCAFTWSSILPYSVGIVVGFGILKMLFMEDLVHGIRRMLSGFLPLFVVVWLVNPAGSDGCRVVGVKNDILAMRAKIGGLVAPDFAGPPATLMRNTVTRMEAINAEFQSQALAAMSENAPAQTSK